MFSDCLRRCSANKKRSKTGQAVKAAEKPQSNLLDSLAAFASEGGSKSKPKEKKSGDGEEKDKEGGEAKKEKKAKHLAYEGLTETGSLLVISGGQVVVQDNKVNTQTGYRPTIATRSVQLASGKW